jgi:hypothetical protein
MERRFKISGNINDNISREEAEDFNGFFLPRGPIKMKGLIFHENEEKDDYI